MSTYKKVKVGIIDYKLNNLFSIYNALKENSYTTLEVAKATNILRANVCRHINTLLLQNTIAVIRQRKCSITGYPYVKEYTANPSLFPKSNQYTLFE